MFLRHSSLTGKRLPRFATRLPDMLTTTAYGPMHALCCNFYLCVAFVLSFPYDVGHEPYN
jgi:hypothetical protein